MTMQSATTGTSCCEALYVEELNHRTANVLQRAIAAIHLSQRGGKEHLDEAMDCLSSAAALHTMLSPTGRQPVELGERLEKIALATWGTCNPMAEINLEIDTDRVITTPENARRISMIVSELVANCVRHAFPNGMGSIVVAVRDDGSHTGVSVEDDGTGTEWSRPGGQGRGIVDALAAALGGAARRFTIPSGGARVEIVMPTVALVAAAPAGRA